MKRADVWGSGDRFYVSIILDNHLYRESLMSKKFLSRRNVLLWIDAHHPDITVINIAEESQLRPIQIKWEAL